MILMYLLILLGIFETISNIIHISRGSIDAIGASAKKQHQELSLSLPNIHFFYKAIIMFIFGIVFLSAGLLAFFEISFSSTIIWIIVISFGLYGVIQAVIYRKNIKVWPAMVVHNIPLALNIFL